MLTYEFHGQTEFQHLVGNYGCIYFGAYIMLHLHNSRTLQLLQTTSHRFDQQQAPLVPPLINSCTTAKSNCYQPLADSDQIMQTNVEIPPCSTNREVLHHQSNVPLGLVKPPNYQQIDLQVTDA